MTVEDIMRPDPGRVDASGSLRDAVQTMLTWGPDGVTVVDDGPEHRRFVQPRSHQI